MIRNRTQQPRHGDKPRNRSAMHFGEPLVRSITVIMATTAPMPKTSNLVCTAAPTEMSTDPTRSSSMTPKSESGISATGPRRVV